MKSDTGRLVVVMMQMIGLAVCLGVGMAAAILTASCASPTDAGDFAIRAGAAVPILATVALFSGGWLAGLTVLHFIFVLNNIY